MIAPVQSGACQFLCLTFADKTAAWICLLGLPCYDYAAMNGEGKDDVVDAPLHKRSTPSMNLR